MRRLVDSLNSNVFASQIDGDVYLLASSYEVCNI